MLAHGMHCLWVLGLNLGNLSDPARRIPHRTAGAPQMAGYRSHGSGETAGKLSGTTGCTDGGNLVFLFVCIPGFHAVLCGGFFCGESFAFRVTDRYRQRRKGRKAGSDRERNR